ncbi:MAG: right-handed parallel beta-helix repeat-containing protein [Candidatus Kapaibacterium sp.]
MIIIRATLLWLLSCCALSARPYYLNAAAGNDKADALTPGSAWKSLNMLGDIRFVPGDTVYLETGAAYTGSIYLDPSDGGTPESPLVITSRGGGTALINTPEGAGIYAFNTSGIVVRGVELSGPGAKVSDGPGIMFYMDSAVGYREYIRIEGCDVHGFQQGIVVGAYHPTWGFRDVIISGCRAHDNSRVGISTFGYESKYTNRDFIVTRCVADGNSGEAGYAQSNSGSGIVISGVDTLLVEHCTAHDNGALNSHRGGGPVGIWMFLCANGIIRDCESHHNSAGLEADGGGFDIDGGCRDCSILYCYSHDNEGAGYEMAEYGAATPFARNTIAWNISRNDARKNSCGAINLWAVDAGHSFRDCQVYNNTILMDTDRLALSRPVGVWILTPFMNGVEIRNNIFITRGPGLGMTRTPPLDSTQVHFVANDYFSAIGPPIFVTDADTARTLQEWRITSPGQERIGTTEYGTAADPMLENPGTSGTAGSTDSLASYLHGYRLLPTSPMIDAGAPLVGTIPGWLYRDFFGNSVPSGGPLDIGCFESPSPRADVAGETRMEGGLSLAPNPASDMVAIRSASGAERYEVIDMKGNVVISGGIINRAGTISLAGIPAGYYQVRITGSDIQPETLGLLVAR